MDVLDGGSLLAVPAHAVCASARHLTPKVRAFIDLAVEAMQSPGEALPYRPSA